MSTMRYLSPYHFNHSLVNIWVYIQYVKRLQTLMQFSYLPHQITHLRYRTQCCRSLYPEITVVLSYMYFISYPSDIFLVTLELWYLDIVVLCSLDNTLSNKIKRILQEGINSNPTPHHLPSSSYPYLTNLALYHLTNSTLIYFLILCYSLSHPIASSILVFRRLAHI